MINSLSCKDSAACDPFWKMALEGYIICVLYNPIVGTSCFWNLLVEFINWTDCVLLWVLSVLEVLQFGRDASVAESWLAGQEPLVRAAELGTNVDEVESLIKRHEAFEKLATAWEERFLLLEKLTTVRFFYSSCRLGWLAGCNLASLLLKLEEQELQRRREEEERARRPPTPPPAEEVTPSKAETQANDSEARYRQKKTSYFCIVLSQSSVI